MDSRARGSGAGRLTLIPVLTFVLCLLLDGAASAGGGIYWPPGCRTRSFRSEPGLRAQSVCREGGTALGARPGRYLFLTPGGTYATGPGTGIYKDNGQLVWWKRSRAPIAEDATLVHYHGRPYLAIWSGALGTNQGYGSGAVALYNEHYQRVGLVTAGHPFAPDSVDGHEFQLTPDGDALFGVYAPVKMRVAGRRRTVLNYVVQKVSLVQGPGGIHTGRVLFSWNSLRDVPVRQSYAPDPGPRHEWDYFHGNSITQDSDGNLLVSGRNTWGVYKISLKTGHVMWEVGARGDPRLREPWCYQHDIVALGQGRYTLFDDGGIGPGCAFRSTWHPARGLIFRVDPSAHGVRLRLIHAYRHSPPIYAEYTGSMQRLPGGQVLIDWGTTPGVTEFDASGRHMLRDLSLSRWSYRGYEFPWTGIPPWPPAAAAALHDNGTSVWASWNGSTQVVAWRVLARKAAASPLVIVRRRVPKRGFQTHLFLPHPYARLTVQALDAHGRVLRTSRPISPASAS